MGAMKNLHLVILLLAGLGIINMMYKISIAFWPSDILLVFSTCCVMVSGYISWLASWYEKYYD
jgi:uncharacterized membrane protein YqjE